MNRNALQAVQRACIPVMAIMFVVMNTVNWMAYMNDWYSRDVQWTVAMYVLSGGAFISAVYVWIGEHLSKREYGIIISGWVALYLLFDFIGVCLGYNLHTKGFMMVLLMTFVSGTAHLIIRIWRKLPR